MWRRGGNRRRPVSFCDDDDAADLSLLVDGKSVWCSPIGLKELNDPP
jgi:hypothetical protein